MNAESDPGDSDDGSDSTEHEFHDHENHSDYENSSGDGPDKLDKPTRNTDHDRAQRATAGRESSAQSERACSANETIDGLGGDRQSHQPTTRETLEGELAALSKERESSARGEGLREVDYSAPGERCSSWTSLDCWSEKASSAKENVTYGVEYAGGAAEMGKNWASMRRENTKGNDKYFHCKGNCEATALGPGGEQAATDLSELREESDAKRNVTSKGMSQAASARDIREDQEANHFGRSIGRERDGTRCAADCYERFKYRREK